MADYLNVSVGSKIQIRALVQLRHWEERYAVDDFQPLPGPSNVGYEEALVLISIADVPEHGEAGTDPVGIGRIVLLEPLIGLHVFNVFPGCRTNAT